MHLNVTLPAPVIFGILTVDTLQQAEERIGGVHGHKGEEAAITALKMISMLRGL
jgi:6,7-dimethyl-8-ribityllumazine synthase